jgi:RNA polymerase sigma-70 factor, ECF subfamily
MAHPVETELIQLLPRMRRYALSLSKSAVQADDLVQSACVKALAGADGWTQGTRFDAWVFRILRNCWIDELRRSRLHASLDDDEAAQNQVGERGEEAAMERLSFGEVRRAIDSLPVDQREVLLLVCVEDMAYREAAEVLGIPLGTVMSRLARARQRLSDLTARTG